ncbi:Hypothetical_protein [Hexamita inflata]|uniref:Hypothetical_protein n=1 Tax=Hexamita inflata TaxID=28002 RepID=A0AA86TSN8_9EUKA|nr:Hypothetical protein HINF_LOCUS14595 [Hexamita inflata]
MFSEKRLDKQKARKAQDQPTELNIQEIDHTEELSSIPVNETTNSNAGTQDTSIKPKKKPRQKSQVQHSQEIQAQMNTQTQPQVTHNTDNTQTNQGAINIQKQVVVNNFNCNNTSLSGQSKSQSTNKSEVARKSQNQQNFKQTAPKQVSQTILKTPVQKPKEAPQAPLPQETKKTQSQIHLQNQSTQAKRRVNRVQCQAELKPASAIQLLKSKHKQANQDAIGKMLIRKSTRSKYAAIWKKLLTYTLKTQSRQLVRFNPTQSYYSSNNKTKTSELYIYIYIYRLTLLVHLKNINNQ